jgi:hypothetical protein
LTVLSPHLRVLIIGPVPELKHPIANCLLRAQMTAHSSESCAIDRSEVERRRHEVVDVLRRVVTKFPNVRMIDPLDAFCDGDKCWPFGPDGVYYLDNDHVSRLGAEKLYQYFQSDFRWIFADDPSASSFR